MAKPSQSLQPIARTCSTASLPGLCKADWAAAPLPGLLLRNLNYVTIMGMYGK